MEFVGASPVAHLVKNLPANAEDARDVGSIPGSGRYPVKGKDNSIYFEIQSQIPLTICDYNKQSSLFSELVFDN